MRRGKSKQCVMSILLIMHLIAKKQELWEKKRKKNVVISDGTCFVDHKEKKRKKKH